MSQKVDAMLEEQERAMARFEAALHEVEAAYRAIPFGVRRGITVTLQLGEGENGPEWRHETTGTTYRMEDE